jgi:hypothetical protein
VALRQQSELISWPEGTIQHVPLQHEGYQTGGFAGQVVTMYCKETQIKCYKFQEVSTLFYGSETWLVTERDENWVKIERKKEGKQRETRKQRSLLFFSFILFYSFFEILKFIHKAVWRRWNIVIHQ